MEYIVISKENHTGSLPKYSFNKYIYFFQELNIVVETTLYEGENQLLFNFYGKADDDKKEEVKKFLTTLNKLS